MLLSIMNGSKNLQLKYALLKMFGLGWTEMQFLNNFLHLDPLRGLDDGKKMRWNEKRFHKTFKFS